MVLWHYSKYVLPRRTVSVFLDVCFARAEIPKHLLKFIVTNIYDRMKPTNHPYFSLKKVQSDLNGKLAVTDEMTFNNLDNYTEERRNYLLRMDFNRGENEINNEESMLSELLNSAKVRAQDLLPDPRPHVDPQHA